MSEGQFDNERARGEESPRRSRSPERRPMDEDRRDDRGRSGGGDGGARNPGNNLHISGLSNKVDERDLEEAFGKYGRLQKVQVMKDPHTGDARGFAFVTFENPDDAGAAIEALNATELQGRVMNVQRARRGRARTPTPGSYHGPPKRESAYPSRGGSYRDSGYGGGGGGGRDRYYDDRRGGGYDDRRGGGYDRREYDRGYDRRGGGYEDRRYDDRYDSRASGGYDRRDEYAARSSYAAPMRDDYRDDRRY